MKEDFVNTVRPLLPNVDYCSIRFVSRYSNIINATRSVVEPVSIYEDEGIMVTVFNKGGYGYGATSNTTKSGIKSAIDFALHWSDYSKDKLTYYPDLSKIETQNGSFFTKENEQWSKVSMKDKADFLLEINRALKSKPSISNWGAGIRHNTIETQFIDTIDSNIRQKLSYILPQMIVSAEYKKEIQTRTYGGHAHARQAGYDFIDTIAMHDRASELSEDVVELSRAKNCENNVTDIIIAPDQMILQIHESIGHPLELDRILGDERNYAGSSFVNEEMFGNYKYGSDCLNVTFDPSVSSELASCNYDDDGTEAKREYLIKDGILLRPIGGLFSSQRAEMDYVACSRSCNWNRPPIDRMGNINLEPGKSSLNEMVSSISNGIYVETNNSWSIDDKRNKFQFGCEKGTLIKDGKFTNIVKNVNYRGITEKFWNNLVSVGDKSTYEILGTSNCGKGEPNQTIFVGHATPACHFKEIDVFGGI